jgi:hypothetical protein
LATHRPGRSPCVARRGAAQASPRQPTRAQLPSEPKRRFPHGGTKLRVNTFFHLWRPLQAHGGQIGQTRLKTGTFPHGETNRPFGSASGAHGMGERFIGHPQARPQPLRGAVWRSPGQPRSAYASPASLRAQEAISPWGDQAAFEYIFSFVPPSAVPHGGMRMWPNPSKTGTFAHGGTSRPLAWPRVLTGPRSLHGPE